MLDGINAGRIHARLFDQVSDSNREFAPILTNDRVQFACEMYPFQFFAALNDIKTVFCGTSKWINKRL